MSATRELVSQLRVIESVAFISRVTSTNNVARRVLEECLTNEIPLPSAIIIAHEQTEGRGRGDRTWSSPRDAGIYSTLLHSRPRERIALLPLEIAVIVARFLRDSYHLDARIKWPNDILVNGKKIAGILIEARTRASEAYTLIGTGINVAPVTGGLSATATSIAENLNGRPVSLQEATAGFIRAIDAGLEASSSQNIVQAWSELAVHRRGDTVSFRIGSRDIQGTWESIDGFGRAVIRQDGKTIEISAAEMISLQS